jgi:hypothetical protein
VDTTTKWIPDISLSPTGFRSLPRELSLVACCFFLAYNVLALQPTGPKKLNLRPFEHPIYPLAGFNMVDSPQADRLHVLIAGAGIGGLSAAIALRQAGNVVDVGSLSSKRG